MFYHYPQDPPVLRGVLSLCDQAPVPETTIDRYLGQNPIANPVGLYVDPLDPTQSLDHDQISSSLDELFAELAPVSLGTASAKGPRELLPLSPPIGLLSPQAIKKMSDKPVSRSAVDTVRASASYSTAATQQTSKTSKPEQAIASDTIKSAFAAFPTSSIRPSTRTAVERIKAALNQRIGGEVADQSCATSEHACPGCSASVSAEKVVFPEPSFTEPPKKRKNKNKKKGKRVQIKEADFEATMEGGSAEKKGKRVEIKEADFEATMEGGSAEKKTVENDHSSMPTKVHEKPSKSLLEKFPQFAEIDNLVESINRKAAIRDSNMKWLLQMLAQGDIQPKDALLFESAFED